MSDLMAATGDAEPGAAPARVPHRVRLRLTPEQAAVMYQWIPPMVELVHRAADTAPVDGVELDLSGIRSVPLSELATLLHTWRRVLGPAVPIVIAGVRPMLAASLRTLDLPAGVTVAEELPRRGRPAAEAGA